MSLLKPVDVAATGHRQRRTLSIQADEPVAGIGIRHVSIDLTGRVELAMLVRQVSGVCIGITQSANETGSPTKTPWSSTASSW
jgi:hypothetical protein